MTWAYYNENDPFAAQWLRNLIAAGHITDGEVDERDIREVQPDDLEGFERCHFFAGIAGWELALQYAGWEGPVWTGSCPCQPFSAAGQRKSGTDERHLWPAWFRLIRECQPDTVFGEQVEGAVGLGWLDRVFADLEDEDYRCGAAVLGAHSVGAPHTRQRLWWVANANDIGRQPRHGETCGARQAARIRSGPESRHSSTDGRMGNAGGTGHALGIRLRGNDGAAAGQAARKAVEQASPWNNHDIIPCADGKARIVEPGTFPLAHGIPSRVGKLRAYGNAIVPQAAAEFIRAIMQANKDVRAA